jgi:hypothetical protein
MRINGDPPFRHSGTDQDERFGRENRRHKEEGRQIRLQGPKSSTKPTHTHNPLLIGWALSGLGSLTQTPPDDTPRLSVTRRQAAKRLEFRSGWLSASAGSKSSASYQLSAQSFHRTYLIPPVPIKINTVFTKREGQLLRIHLFIYSSSGHLSGLPESTITLLVGVLFFFYDPSTLSLHGQQQFIEKCFLFFSERQPCRASAFYSGRPVGQPIIKRIDVFIFFRDKMAAAN